MLWPELDGDFASTGASVDLARWPIGHAWSYDHGPVADGGDLIDNGGMNDTWLDHGHGTNPTHLNSVFSSTIGAQPLGIRDTLGATGTSGAARVGKRPSRVLVGTALWMGVAVGSAGAVWAVRDALFPQIGPTSASVWQNPGRAAATPTVTTLLAATAPTTSAPTTSAPATSAPDTSVSGNSATQETTASATSGSGTRGSTPSTTIDDSGDQTTSTATTATAPSSGSGSGGGGGTDVTFTSTPTVTTEAEPETTVDDHGGGSGSGSGSGSPD